MVFRAITACHMQTFSFKICFARQGRKHLTSKSVFRNNAMHSHGGQRWCVLQKRWFQTHWPFLLTVPKINFLTDIVSRAAGAARIDWAPPACARKILRRQAKPGEVRQCSGKQVKRRSRNFGAESRRVHRFIRGIFCRPSNELLHIVCASWSANAFWGTTVWPRSLSDKWGGARAWLLDQSVPFLLSLNEIVSAPLTADG